jgi:DNA-binding CsgD family transcriptional regulator
VIALATHSRQPTPLPIRNPAIIAATVAAQPTALALDCLDQAVFIVDAETRIQFENVSARRVVETGRLMIRHGLLASSNACETMTLRRLVRERIDSAARGQAPMAFHRFDADGEALCLGITAVHQAAQPPLAIIFATKPSQISLPDAQQLRTHFDLTEAQARLAIEITRGHGLQACARKLGIAVTTARSHLKQIFGKTNTKRQAEFVRLVYACRLLRTDGLQCAHG